MAAIAIVTAMRQSLLLRPSRPMILPSWPSVLAFVESSSGSSRFSSKGTSRPRDRDMARQAIGSPQSTRSSAGTRSRMISSASFSTEVPRRYAGESSRGALPDTSSAYMYITVKNRYIAFIFTRHDRGASCRRELCVAPEGPPHSVSRGGRGKRSRGSQSVSDALTMFSSDRGTAARGIAGGRVRSDGRVTR